MAIDHSSHDHPATPAARAACRRILGAVCTCGGNAATDGPVLIHSHTCPMKPTGVGSARLMAVEPRGRARRVGDMPDVPHVFGEIIHRAWTEGWAVTTATPYNADERRVEIVSDAGTAQLVWRSNQPHGVTAVWFRPCNTSIVSRIDDAPVLAATVTRLRGM